MKRSEYQKISYSVAVELGDRLTKEIDDIAATKDGENFTYMLARIVAKISFIAADAAASIIEKAGLIQFDSEENPTAAESHVQNPPL